MTLIDLIAQGESQTLEFKTSFGEEVLETISAFSNADGGVILIGVADDGSIPGLIVGKKTLEDWANKIQAAIDPRIQPFTKVVAVTQNNKNVAELRVEKSTTAELALTADFSSVLAKPINE